MLSIGPGWFLQIFNILVMVYILKRLLFKPVNAMITGRTERIKAQFDEAKLKDDTAARLIEEYSNKLEQIKVEQAELMSQTRAEAQVRANALIKEAELEASDIKKRAADDIEESRKQAMSALKDEIASIALIAASKVLEAEIDGAKHKAMIDSVIEKVGAQPWRN